MRVGEVLRQRYEIERLLTEDGRSRTYVVRDINYRDRHLALSVIKPDALVRDPGSAQRQADVLASVGSHSHIVAFFDARTNGELQYVVLEHYESGTLADLLARSQEQGEGLSREELLRFARQLAKAIAHIHRHGVVHRGVSPYSIWLDERGKSHLGGFDWAIFEDGQGAGKPVASNPFASPEEAHAEHLDARSDLYSLGGVIAFLGSGETTLETAKTSFQKRSDLPTSLHDLVDRLLAADREDRPATAEAVVQELEEALWGRDLRSVIAGGEGDRVEFKFSFAKPEGLERVPRDERSARLKELQPILEKMAIKTIAAFLNSRGGTLLIGVSDSGQVVGIEQDFELVPGRKKDADDWQIYFKNRVKEKLGSDAWSCISLSLERAEGHLVARVDCAERHTATWVDQVEFYVRTASASELLSGPAQVQYILETGRATSNRA